VFLRLIDGLPAGGASFFVDVVVLVVAVFGFVSLADRELNIRRC